MAALQGHLLKDTKRYWDTWRPLRQEWTSEDRRKRIETRREVKQKVKRERCMVKKGMANGKCETLQEGETGVFLY